MISLGCNSKVWYNEHSKDTAIPIHQKKKKDKCPPPKKMTLLRKIVHLFKETAKGNFKQKKIILKKKKLIPEGTYD